MSKVGVLLLNIGSPSSYEVKDVQSYLKRFLMDKEVINLPYPLRWLLVHAIIVPKRGAFSAANYKKIWIHGEGSPLTVFTQKFARGLQSILGPEVTVKIGMRYAEPSIDRALSEFSSEGIEHIILAPLFPQYAEATTGSSVRYTLEQIQKKIYGFRTKTLDPFFREEAFIGPSAKIAAQILKNNQAEHYLFSFHGLPESHIRKIPGCLTSSHCCEEKNACAKNCYRAQCFASASAIAQRLGLAKSEWSISFQSRLGRAEWLKPSTDDVLKEIAKSGKKSLAVMCPSFVADCIETLEEIGLGGEELFHEHGGKSFHLIPCVNENAEWIEGFAELIQNKLKTSEVL